MTTPTGPWYRQRKWRWPILIGFAIVLAVILIGVNMLLRVVIFRDPIGDPISYISPVIIGFGAAFGVGFAQPWGERRRARRKQEQHDQG